MPFKHHTLFVVPAFFVSAALVACSGSTPSSTTTPSSAADSSEQELKISPSSNTASLEIGDGSTCTDLHTLVESRRDQLHALCNQGEVAFPESLETTGCNDGEAKKIVFKCFVAQLPPPPPPGQCRPIRVAGGGPGGAPRPVCDHAPVFADTLCPSMGEGLEPPSHPGNPGGPGGPGRPGGPSGETPPGGDDGAHPPIPTPPGAGPGSGSGAHPPVPGGDTPPAPEGNHPPPPRFECCAPPLPPGGGGDHPPPPPGDQPTPPSNVE